MITPAMTVADVLATHPQTLEVFVTQHSAFERLRNPVLRRFFARMVTVEQAARIAQIDSHGLLQALNAACGYNAQGGSTTKAALLTETDFTTPKWFEPSKITQYVDVRESQRNNDKPLTLIMPAIKQLAPGNILLLRSTFEPVPLYAMLGKRGFTHCSRQYAEEDWLIFFYCTTAEEENAQPNCVVLDNRGLKPPEPMVQTFAALQKLPATQQLITITDRQPLVLYEMLAEEDWRFETLEMQQDGFWTLIQR